MARIRNTVSLLVPFPDANKLTVGASIKVKDTPCVLKKIGTRNINGFVRVTFAKQKPAPAGESAMKLARELIARRASTAKAD